MIPMTANRFRAPRARKPRAKGAAALQRRLRVAPARTPHAAEQISRTTVSAETLQENATALEACSAISACAARSSMRGRTVVTLYELSRRGHKVSVYQSPDDIARSMSALSARVA